MPPARFKVYVPLAEGMRVGRLLGATRRLDKPLPSLRRLLMRWYYARSLSFLRKFDVEVGTT
jgi:hypothetical protein